jgi:putative membrane protein
MESFPPEWHAPRQGKWQKIGGSIPVKGENLKEKIMRKTIRNRIWPGALSGMAVFFLFVPVAAAQRGYGGWGMGPGMMPGWGGGWLMIVFWVLILIGLILLIKWLVQMTRGDREGDRRPSALEILKERYARGEIDQQEYKARKRDLLE